MSAGPEVGAMCALRERADRRLRFDGGMKACGRRVALLLLFFGSAISRTRPRNGFPVIPSNYFSGARGVEDRANGALRPRGDGAGSDQADRMWLIESDHAALLANP